MGIVDDPSLYSSVNRRLTGPSPCLSKSHATTRRSYLGNDETLSLKDVQRRLLLGRTSQRELLTAPMPASTPAPAPIPTPGSAKASRSRCARPHHAQPAPTSIVVLHVPPRTAVILQQDPTSASPRMETLCDPKAMRRALGELCLALSDASTPSWSSSKKTPTMEATGPSMTPRRSPTHLVSSKMQHTKPVPLPRRFFGHEPVSTAKELSLLSPHTGRRSYHPTRFRDSSSSSSGDESVVSHASYHGYHYCHPPHERRHRYH